jgi:hypothetical protein
MAGAWVSTALTSWRARQPRGSAHAAYHSAKGALKARRRPMDRTKPSGARHHIPGRVRFTVRENRTLTRIPTDHESTGDAHI